MSLHEQIEQSLKEIKEGKVRKLDEVLEEMENIPLLAKVYKEFSDRTGLPISSLNIKIEPFGKTRIEITVDVIEEKDSKDVKVKMIFEKHMIEDEWKTTLKLNHKLIEPHQEKVFQAIENIKQYLTEVA